MCTDMALTCTLTTFTTLISLCMFCVNAATYKEFLQMGQSMGTNDTVISHGGNFELGFFNRTRENSIKYYVGIWYRKVPNDKIVWVANRDSAFESSSAVLTIEPDGNMEITDGRMMYRLNSVSNSFSTYAYLLDSGNLVLLNSSNQAILWQSFDNPTDNILSGMNIEYYFASIYSDGYPLLLITSWTSEDDPFRVAFSAEYDGSSARLMLNKDSNMYQSHDTIDFIRSRNDSRLVLEVSGEIKQEYWSEEEKHWVYMQSSRCGTNNLCGKFSIFDPQALFPCVCLHGFKPLDADSWSKGDTYDSCVRKTPLSCSSDGFFQFKKVHLPETLNEYIKPNIGTAKACESICFTNCSCVAYAYNGTCQLWLGPLSSLKNISTDVYSSDNTNPVFNLRIS